MYLLSYFSHHKAVQTAAAALGIRAHVRVSDLALVLTADRKTAEWRPKFMAKVAGHRLAYTDQLGSETVGFAGWNPNRLLQWPTATSKEAFKRFAIGNGIQTPAACFDPRQIAGPFIVKAAHSSFGEGIRGPFLAFDGDEEAQALRAGEFYENFIPGTIAKAWCWGAHCVAIHLHSPTIVVGDGQSSLTQLVVRLPNSRGADNDWGLITKLGKYCGVPDLGAPVPAGKEVLVEYRYGSRYEPASFKNPNRMPSLEGSAVMAQFADAAGKLASTIPTGRPYLFSLDAMVSAQGEAWFLEMNCNPLVHPDAYALMLSEFAQGSGGGARDPAVAVSEDARAALVDS